jgi:DNA repair protein SbcD/Mre11
MTTLLAIGDIHLGRLPAALPDDLAGRRRELGPESAWARAVTEAINRKVDAVLLAGDVVERGRDFFVAYGQLKSGVEKLEAAGIPVLAVAGNHDTHVLPRLASEIDSLHLLGAGGQWQQFDLDGASVIGWSFPRPQVHHSPLDNFPGQRGRQPLIGLLHCDRDQSESPYAPVSSTDLKQAPVGAWLLGHIHQSDALDCDRPIGYLGSISALRASETGARGPWLIEVDKKAIKASQLPLAPLRYELLDVDCAELGSVDHLGEAILAASRSHLAAMEEAEYRPEVIGFRVRLTGHSALSSQLPAAATGLLDEARSWHEYQIQCFIHRISVETLPRLAVDNLAKQSDPAGLLARRLQALNEPDSDERQRLIQLGRAALEPIVGSREFRALERRLSDEEIAARLREAARLALSKLIAQRETGT